MAGKWIVESEDSMNCGACILHLKGPPAMEWEAAPIARTALFGGRIVYRSHLGLCSDACSKFSRSIVPSFAPMA